MSQFTCEDISALLSGLLDDEVDAETRRVADAHLAQCATCRKRFDEAERLDWMARSAIEVDEVWPQSLEDRILAAVRKEESPASRSNAARRWMIVAWAGWTAAAAAVTFAALIGWRSNEAAPRDDLMATNIGATDAAPAFGEDEAAPTPNEVEAAGASNGGVASTAIVDVNPDTPPLAPEYDRIVRFALDNVNRFEERIGSLRASTSSLVDDGVELVDRFAEEQRERLARVDVEATESAETSDESIGAPNSDVRVAMATDGRGVEENTASELAVPGDPEEDAIYMASVLLDVIRQAESDESFEELRDDINEVLESDRVLERLAAARGRLDTDAESAATVGQAWSTLEWVAGPVDSGELRSVQRMMTQNRLPQRLENLTARLSH